MIVPKRSTSLKLFATGATVGPLVDSIHNQCLLQYDLAPISIPSPIESHAPYLLCTSWLIPPLLGIAYVVLGGVLPRLFQSVLGAVPISDKRGSVGKVGEATAETLRMKGLVAVSTTALIIKLSDYLQTHPGEAFGGGAEANVAVMALAALSQWALLDRTPAALLAASITAVGGPLSELPFVAHGCWHYISAAADYLPLAGSSLDGAGETLVRWALGDEYRNLALSSITGPCYFAVTMDAIALGRWFDSEKKNLPVNEACD
eukprot:CAMPEP_0183307430 /NCGR_PEP_ID=MMETSP0160_2-20130417/17328_1 /TAXON_ID=2839 ORGANISM="Odontella Sinensis, Strain Grunow 1884" /NCGR_SAMPLE_ID=MMETSP0160_2 /ASSEMBLY_ACC=CAM_ASM_000250 /LENGTH=260 /DNA_ID=CAMNT_0025471013 /DNA_START=35 /DNA_END=817 /DNA_ORIENTATION=-